jgi:pSer/pThr/pTyr-binding forkhead associated (FHA) protein
MKEQPNLDKHILVIYDQPEGRQVLLQAATYSIGRDKHNAIMIPHKAISRQHALLLRMPLPGNQGYCYRILDGNVAGKSSMNGFTVNDQKYSSYDLQPGDKLCLGGAILAEYKVLSIPSTKYLGYMNVESVQYQSVKSKATNPSETLVNIPLPISIQERLAAEVALMEEDDIPPTELFSH